MEQVTILKIIYLILTLVEIGLAGHRFGFGSSGDMYVGYIGSFIYIALLCFIASLIYLILYGLEIVDYNKKGDFILHLVCSIFLLIAAIMMVIWYFTWISYIVEYSTAGLLVELTIMMILSIVILALYLWVCKLCKS